MYKIEVYYEYKSKLGRYKGLTAKLWNLEFWINYLLEVWNLQFFNFLFINFQRLTTTQLKHDGRQFHKVWDTICSSFSLDWTLWPTSSSIIFRYLEEMTLLLREEFPYSTVYPVLGDQDFNPPSQAKPQENMITHLFRSLYWKSPLSNVLFIATCNLSAALKHCK